MIIDIGRYVQKYGKWTAHCIEYAPGMRTRPEVGPEWLTNMAETYAFWFENYARKPMAEAAFLDIGCLEGGLSYHFARLGASALGIEIRDDSLGKCSFLTDAFPNLPLRFMKENMFNLSREKHGSFDCIVMAGTLYHVDAPQIMPTLVKLREMTEFLFIETHISTMALEKYADTAHGVTLYGRSTQEHTPGDDEALRQTKLWASYDNDFSFWMTENSLVNALQAAGFDWVTRPLLPSIPWLWKDRAVWLAGVSTSVIKPALPPLPDPDPRVTEHEQLTYNHLRNAPNPATIKI